MIESVYTSAIHKKLPTDVFHWKINDNFAGGVPDAFYMIENDTDAACLWVEYKLIKALPKRGSTLIKPDVSPQQFIWLRRLENAGKRVRIVVGVESVKVGRSAGSIIMTLSEAEHGLAREGIESRMLSYQGVAEAYVTIMKNNFT